VIAEGALECGRRLLLLTTIEASTSSTSPGSTRPAARAGPNAELVSARCAQATCRAAARADAISASCRSSSWSSSRQHVESEATGPNNAA